MIMTVGKGVHYCLGSPFARLESEIALDGLFQRFPDLARDIALIEPDPRDWAGWVMYLVDQLEKESKKREKQGEFKGILNSLQKKIT